MLFSFSPTLVVSIIFSACSTDETGTKAFFFLILKLLLFLQPKLAYFVLLASSFWLLCLFNVYIYLCYSVLIFMSVAAKNTERDRKTHLINRWLRDWCRWWNFGFFDHGEVYMAPGLLARGGVQLPQRAKRILAHELAGLIKRALN